MLNTANDYPMPPFPHHHLPTAADQQQFYHNLYSTTAQSTAVANAKKFDMINNNSPVQEIFTATKDVTENTRRFSVNNLLKSPTSISNESGTGEKSNHNHGELRVNNRIRRDHYGFL